MRIKTDRMTRPEPETALPTADLPVVTTECASLCVIDEALATYGRRELVSGSEVVDLLLDLRSAMGLHASAVVAQSPSV